MAAPFAAALLRYGGPHLHIVVVGPPAAEATRALLQTALNVRAPLRTVQTLDPLMDVERLVRDGSDRRTAGRIRVSWHHVSGAHRRSGRAEPAGRRRS